MRASLQTGPLVEFWARYRPVEAPFVHPDDRNVTLSLPHDKFRTVEQLAQSAYFGAEGSRLQLGLIPAPYAGDLAQADIVILMLNPGFSLVDFYGENEVPEYRDTMVRTLHQELSGEEFPFVHLNPRFCWSGGYRWWERKLRNLALALTGSEGSYYAALRMLSQRIAALELMPYHSVVCPSGILSKLRSVSVAKEYVKDVLVPRARRGEITLIVTRQVKFWGLSDFNASKEIVIYDSGHARGASLSTNSTGGKAILERLETVK